MAIYSHTEGLMANFMLHVCQFIFLVTLHGGSYCIFTNGDARDWASVRQPLRVIQQVSASLWALVTRSAGTTPLPHIAGRLLDYSAAHHSDISLLRRELPFCASSLETPSAFTAIPAIRGLATAHTHQRLGILFITRTITTSSMHP